MRLADQFRFVRQNMGRNKSRLFMTVLATAMGCAFLIVLASVGFGLQKSLVDNLVGDRLVTAITIYSKDPAMFDEVGLYDEDIEYFRSLPKVKAVTYSQYVGQGFRAAVGAEEVDHNRTVAVDFEAEAKSGFELDAGRMPQNGNEVVVGYHVRPEAQEEGADDNAVASYADASEWLNETIVLHIQYYENGELRTEPIEAVIAGVRAKPTKEWNADKAIYIGGELMERIEGITGTRNGELLYFDGEMDAEQIEAALAELPKADGNRQYNEVQVVADNASHVKGLGETIREKGYYNHSIANELQQINVMFMIMKIGLIFVGTIAVLIASIGIYNTMTMAVTERAQDIGIMKAIGAHPSVIQRVFLLESGMIGLLGAFIGTAVSYGISAAVNAGLPVLIKAFMDEELPADFMFSLIPAYLAALSCLISLGVAMLSGARPAKRATRVDVLSALRRDI